MMKRDINYMRKTLKELIDTYAFENGRDNKEDADETKRRIINEVYARVDKVFAVLNRNEAVDTESLYKELLQAADKPKA